MNYKILVLCALATSALHGSATQADRAAVQAAYAGNQADPQKLVTMCRALGDKDLSVLSGTPQGAQFVTVYGKTVASVCGASAELNALIAAANTYNGSTPAIGPKTATSDQDASNFLDAMTAYIAAGGSTAIYQDLLTRAKTQIDALNATNAGIRNTGPGTPATRAAALNAIAAEAGEFAIGYALQDHTDPNSLNPSTVMNDIRNGFAILERTSGIDRITAYLPYWFNQINARLAAGAGGGPGASDAILNGLAAKFNTPDNAEQTATILNNFFDYLGDTGRPLNPLNRRSLLDTCNLIAQSVVERENALGALQGTGLPPTSGFTFDNNNSIAHNINSLAGALNNCINRPANGGGAGGATQAQLIAERQKNNLMTYLGRCQENSGDRAAVPGFTLTGNTNGDSYLENRVTDLRTQIQANAVGGQAQIQAVITAFNATVTAHNANITAQQIEATRALFTTASSPTARKNYMGYSVSNELSANTLCGQVIQTLITVYNNLTTTAKNLYVTQQTLATATQTAGVTVPGGFTRIQTLVNVNGATPDTTNTVFAAGNFTAPATPFAPGRFEVYAAAYPTT